MGLSHKDRITNSVSAKSLPVHQNFVISRMTSVILAIFNSKSRKFSDLMVSKLCIKIYLACHFT